MLLLATLLPLVASSALVRADEAPGIETVVVTAEKRAEAANSIGMSIQAFSGAQLYDNRVTSLKDLGTVVPSFTVSQGYQGVPIYSMRGIGFNTINLGKVAQEDETGFVACTPAGIMEMLGRTGVNLKGRHVVVVGRSLIVGKLPTVAYAAVTRQKVGSVTVYFFRRLG